MLLVGQFWTMLGLSQRWSSLGCSITFFIIIIRSFLDWKFFKQFYVTYKADSRIWRTACKAAHAEAFAQVALILAPHQFTRRVFSTVDKTALFQYILVISTLLLCLCSSIRETPFSPVTILSIAFSGFKMQNVISFIDRVVRVSLLWKHPFLPCPNVLAPLMCNGFCYVYLCSTLGWEFTGARSFVIFVSLVHCVLLDRE